MLPLIALCCVIASCVFAFFLQKNCKPTSIRFRGKKIETAKNMVVADVYEVFIQNGKYYAKCSIPGDTSRQTIEIDKAMMASFPDQKSDEDKPVIKVLLYEETTDVGLKIYTLAPEEIRFKLNLHIVQDKKKTLDDIQQASIYIGYLYQIRLVLWTLAWVGVYQSSLLSILFSGIAAWISAQNVIPFRYTNITKCGIINTSKNSGNSKKENTIPPGYDSWSDERRYLYSLEQRVQAKKAVDTSQDAGQASEPEDSHTDNAEATKDIQAASQDSNEGTESDFDGQAEDDADVSAKAATDTAAESDDEEEDASFFTDDELASEGESVESEEDDTETGEDVPSEDTGLQQDFSDDDDEFEADGFEADTIDSDTESEKSSAENPEAEIPAPQSDTSTPLHSRQTSMGKHGKKGSGKKTVKSVLDDLIDDDSE